MTGMDTHVLGFIKNYAVSKISSLGNPVRCKRSSAATEVDVHGCILAAIILAELHGISNEREVLVE